MMGARHRNDGWVPQQHGAWAMLLVPLLVGIVWRVRDDGLDTRTLIFLPSLVIAWFIGYFAFNAASLWLKARPNRRLRFTRPLATYAAISAVAACVALAAEPLLLSWSPLYGILTGLTLWLVTRGDERAVASGFLTTAAAASMATTVRSSNLFAATIEQWEPALLCLAYFFGTVLYVKTLIRQRGKWHWLALSVGYHAALALTAAAAAFIGGMSEHWNVMDWLVWTGFAVILVIRAAAVPLYGPMRGRTVTPKQAGIGEAILSTVLAVLLLVL